MKKSVTVRRSSKRLQGVSSGPGNIPAIPLVIEEEDEDSSLIASAMGCVPASGKGKLTLPSLKKDDALFKKPKDVVIKGGDQKLLLSRAEGGESSKPATSVGVDTPVQQGQSEGVYVPNWDIKSSDVLKRASVCRDLIDH